MDEREQYLQQAATTRLATMTAAFFSGAGFEIVSKASELAGVVERDVLPEPWDIPDHIGNFTESGMITAATFTMLSLMSNRKGTYYEPGALKRVAGATMLISAAVQTAGERYGHVVGYGSNGDIVDTAYGLAFTIVPTLICVAGFGKARKLEMQASETPKSNNRSVRNTPIVPSSESEENSVTTTKQPRPPVNPRAKKAKRKQQKASRRKNR